MILDLSLVIITGFIVVIAAICIILLERFIPYNKGQKVFREGFFNDFVLYTVVQSYVAGICIYYIIQWLQNLGLEFYVHFDSKFSLWQQFVFFFILHDFYIYWFHRFQHKIPLLWRIHEAHHSSIEVDWLSGSRSHFFEILINQTVEFAPMFLLGASPEVAVYKGMIDAVWGMFIHSNTDISMGILRYFFNGPEMHRWHHANDEKAFDKNFSTKLAVWDWMFGTAYFPNKEKAGIYGLAQKYPLSFIQQFFYVFRLR